MLGYLWRRHRLLRNTSRTPSPLGDHVRSTPKITEKLFSYCFAIVQVMFDGTRVPSGQCVVPLSMTTREVTSATSS